VVAEIRRAHTESPLDLVVVDYLGQLSGLGSTSSDKNVALGAATSAFHDVGCELGFTVMCLAQTSRAFVRRGGYNPQKSDLRDCGEIENNSKSITFVSQPALFARDQLSQGEELPADVNEREFIVHHRKGRNTVPWADVELWFDGATMQFRSVDNVHAEPAGQNLLGW